MITKYWTTPVAQGTPAERPGRKAKGSDVPQGGKTAVLPTATPLPHSNAPRRPPPRSDARFIYHGGLVLRGIMGLFLLWISYQFPQMVWSRAWIIGVSLLGVDGFAALSLYRWSHHLRWAIHGTLIADGLLGWATAWAYSQSPTTIVPALLSLLTLEILAYYRTRRGGIVAGFYILVTNSFLGFLPGIHGAPLLPWDRIIFWTVTDGLILGAVMIVLHLSWRTLPVLRNLTPREREVYHLSAAGLTTAQIAEYLHIEPSTVRTHLLHIHRKLEGLSPEER